jgi:hypothetical protein
MTKQLSFTNTHTKHTNVGTSSLLQASSPIDLASSRHFFKLDHSFVFHYLPRMKPASLAVYVALGVHANRERQCWPSLATIATYSGYRKGRSVSKRLRELETAGLIDLRARRRTSKLASIPFLDLPEAGFTPVKKEWLREFAPKIGPNALAVWFVLRAMANGRWRWRQAVHEILTLMQLSRDSFDRAVRVLRVHGLIHTRRGTMTEWTLLAGDASGGSAETSQIAPTKNRVSEPSLVLDDSEKSAALNSAKTVLVDSVLTASEENYIEENYKEEDETHGLENTATQRPKDVQYSPPGNDERKHECFEGWVYVTQDRQSGVTRCADCEDARQAQAEKKAKEEASRRSAAQFEVGHSDAWSSFADYVFGARRNQSPAVIDNFLPERNANPFPRSTSAAHISTSTSRSSGSCPVVDEDRFRLLQRSAADLCNCSEWTQRDSALLRRFGGRTQDLEDFEVEELLDEVYEQIQCEAPHRLFACALQKLNSL